MWYSPRLNKTDVVVANQVVDYWQNFASNSGDPNGGGGLTHWPMYSKGNATLMLDRVSSVGLNVGQRRCGFWDALHPLWL